MDLFKFTPDSSADATVLKQGQPINGAESIMWAERYSEPGDFEIKAPLSSGLRTFLPEGTLISHVDTAEVMIVENHQITESQDENPTLTITGRSMETILEQRFVGVNRARSTSTIDDYDMTAANTANQVVALINAHISTPYNSNDELENVVADTDVVSGTSEARTIDRGDVFQRVYELLAIDDLGLKTIRRTDFPVSHGSSLHTTFFVYGGSNKSNQITFSWTAGDLETAEYLFSNKRIKTTAFVVGRYVFTVVDRPGYSKYARRIMMVDASDIDGHFNSIPTGGSLTSTLAKMVVRGRQALRSQRRITLSRTDVSDITKYRYRRDYNVGDLVTLDADYNQSVISRIIEFVEIEDENGESGHPTLSLPDPNEEIVIPG